MTDAGDSSRLQLREALETTVERWRANAEVLKRAARNPRNGDAENAHLNEGAATQEFCANEAEALLTSLPAREDAPKKEP